MRIKLIAAVAENNAIGKDNDLIWSLPDDMKFFKNTTMNLPVIMGRLNYDSIPDKYRPLPNRTNCIITRNPDFKDDKCLVFNNIKDCVKQLEKDNVETCFVIGGGQIYKEFLEAGLVDEMYLTHIHETFDGDVFFPEFNKLDWQVEIVEKHPADDRHAHAFSILKYIKTE